MVFTSLYFSLWISATQIEFDFIGYQRAGTSKEFRGSPARSFYIKDHFPKVSCLHCHNMRGLATGGELCTKSAPWEKIQKANLAVSRSKISPPLGIVKFAVLGQLTFLWAHIHSRRLIIRGGYICLWLVLAVTSCSACINAAITKKSMYFPQTSIT